MIPHMLSRRSLLALTAAGAGYGVVRMLQRTPLASMLADDAGFGPLVDDPAGLVRLPRGFSYKVLSRTGETMSDGLLVPGAHDCMGAFPGPDGRTILVRNHELTLLVEGAFGDGCEKLHSGLRERLYDAGRGVAPPLGGTTTLVFDTRTQTLERHWLSLAGTLRNCAGGVTPWGSWISCEESDVRATDSIERDHGFCFEVPARADGGLVEPVPLVAMGRCNHEAIAVDPRTGFVYLTEDREDGLLYRFLPDQPGKLAAGGRLQALALADRKSAETGNRKERAIALGEELAVRWVDLEEPASPRDDLRYQGFSKGAARFVRAEGMAYADGSVWFMCTTGGAAGKGQVWRLRPDPAEQPGDGAAAATRLELFFESPGAEVLDCGDNITVAPWGDLIVCEDEAGPADGKVHILGVAPAGREYRLARNAMSRGEMAGATFSPDGTTLFVNIQRPGLTLAITGPWRRG